MPAVLPSRGSDRRHAPIRLVVLLAFGLVALATAGGADAARLVFSSTRADGVRELYVVGRDGQGEHRITFNEIVERQPVFSPDGTRIAFAGLRNGVWDIYTVADDGRDLRQLTADSARDDYPRWTADGRITYQRGSEPCPCSAWIMDADGRNAEQIPIPGNVLTPEPSRHGQRLAYASDIDGRSRLYVSNVKGTARHAITDPVSGFGDFMPRWSPSGNKIAFLRDDGNGQDLYLVHANGTDLRRLTLTPSRTEYYVSWQGDGELAFAAAPPFRLWALNLGTGEEQALRTWPSAPLHEDFEDGIRDASLWHQVSDPGGTIGEVGGRLVAAIAGTAVPGGQWNQVDEHWGSQCELRGDFDFEVDWELLTWPAHGGFFAQLSAFFADAGIARHSNPWEPPFDESISAWRNFPFANAVINSTAVSGSFRLVRLDGTIFAYERTVGAGWNPVFSAPDVAGATVYGIGLWAQGASFTHQDGAVAFDDFRLSSGDLTCPSWWSDIWVDVG